MSIIKKLLPIKESRILGLDIIRAYAIFWVVYSHGAFLIPEAYREIYVSLLPSLDGVSIFFVLSGYLIGKILIRTIDQTDFTKKDLGNFWIRRWFRTLPVYFLVLCILIWIDSNTASRTYIDTPYYKYFFFLQNFFSAQPDFFLVSWSLSIEEWFYLAFPICCYLLYRFLPNKRHSLLIAAFIFLIVPFLLRLIAYSNGLSDRWDLDIRQVVIYRLDSMMYGIIGAYIHYYKEELWIKYKIPALILGIIIIVFLTIVFQSQTGDLFFLGVYYYNLESIAVLLLLPFFSQLKRIGFPPLAYFITFLSLISYSLYLIHLTVQTDIVHPIYVNTGLEASDVPYKFLINYFNYWIISMVLSYLLFLFFERPIMNLRDKFNIN